MSNKNNIPFLFKKYPKLKEKIPWVKLLPEKTPVEQLSKLTDHFKVDSLWIKRDDISCPNYGGNKPRKLEFILADAKSKGYKKVLTVGGYGSNFCVANATSCKKLGLKAIAFLVDQPMVSFAKKNLLLNVYYENELIYVKKRNRIRWFKLFKKLFDSSIYFMLTSGGSVPLGTLGFVNAAFELEEQIINKEIPEPDHIFIPYGSAGTVAGLALGLKLANIKSQVHAIQIASSVDFEDSMKLSYDTLKLLNEYDKAIPEVEIDNINFETEFLGDGYARSTKEGTEAIEKGRKIENIDLDTTYSGKTFAAFLKFIENNKQELKEKTVLFWNTYNSVNVSELIENVDYRKLPKKLHWIFEE
jgi:D-cysteine desulfhydrase